MNFINIKNIISQPPVIDEFHFVPHWCDEKDDIRSFTNYSVAHYLENDGVASYPYFVEVCFDYNVNIERLNSINVIYDLFEETDLIYKGLDNNVILFYGYSFDSSKTRMHFYSNTDKGIHRALEKLVNKCQKHSLVDSMKVTITKDLERSLIKKYHTLEEESKALAYSEVYIKRLEDAEKQAGCYYGNNKLVRFKIMFDNKFDAEDFVDSVIFNLSSIVHEHSVVKKYSQWEVNLDVNYNVLKISDVINKIFYDLSIYEGGKYKNWEAISKLDFDDDLY